ncbi:ATPase [Mangrovimonas yunxiaonensis]|uniref:ATPase n=1 Tax=Mangrovimonas yunxiaonensis TaxID=1197477 RepID=A0A084TLT1_9FLAO|nr:ATP-binding protein [Mangrovimonas yunxiaonensis]KFB01667.1 ATPase [Mangrovimonas yunxiaonensis]GGH35330.1 ATPase [Mangrovimonas yunxiaonensis]
MISRPSYIKALTPFIGKPQIKILTGIRRSGKSTVLHLLKEELLQRGVQHEQIVSINFESFVHSELLKATALYKYVKNKIKTPQKYYLLLDEIQEVEHWEKAVNSFLVDFNADIYLTGSNSHLLSSELATYLAGRYVEIPVYTLSYKEFLDFRQAYFSEAQNAGNGFVHYLRKGGFPVIHTADYPEASAYKVVYDIYSSVILRDTVQRYKIRDIELLERVIKYALNNIGNTFSGKNVADYFKSQQRKIDINTVYNYLNALVGAFILYRVPRYDVKGKEILKTQEKFYVSDISIIYATMGNRDRMIGGILENIVFLELKRRGYAVFVGKLEHNEIDFVAEKNGSKIYVQVAYKLENEQTVKREFGNLLAIDDQFPKYVVTMDEFWKDAIEGITHLYITEFLMSDNI